MSMNKLNDTKNFLNENYKKDRDFNVRLNVWTLRTIGTWPKSKNRSWLRTIEQFLLRLACYVLLLAILIPGGINVIFESKDFYSQLRLSSALSFFVMAIIKYCVLIAREDDIYSMVFYYIALPLTRAKIIEEGGNLTYRRLVYPFPRVLLDVRHSPANEIFYTIQLFSGFVAHNITVAACGLAALLAMHVCGQLQVLMAWLENLVDGREKDDQCLDQRLASVVEQHVRIVNFVAHMENLLREISLVEVVGCTINMCFLGYHTMMEWDPKEPVSGLTFIILLISVTFNIFIFCYIGELLSQEAVKIGDKSYMIDWYRMPVKKSLAVSLIISMSRSTTRITAGSIIELSISSFGDVVKTSVAYLNMLRQFTD
ncbi:odorant receptor 85b-like isoform X2 [Ceratina calcarata]|uniref:Odorant receptor n=1 Tax=Ceratina calcarata TaxID=156304 RepID=A0AAJ7RZX5_9HYME|nr:odorant receptor 85b-like isoform X2 [Ceratina calcarata]